MRLADLRSGLLCISRLAPFEPTAKKGVTVQEQRRKAAACAAFIRRRIKKTPEIGVLTGTGLGDAAAALAQEANFPYDLLPHFPVSTVQSHAGRLLFGEMAGKPTAVLQGRIHLYEGYGPKEVTFPVRVLQELGVGTLLVTNAAGGINPGFTPGQIMLLADHLNLTGENPLAGANEDQWGPRFPDMSAAYDPALARLAEAAAALRGLRLQKGVYAGLKGPSLETPAEVRFLRSAGADAVGFSTVQEVIAAVHGGIRVLGLSIITNVHDPDNPEPASVEEIIEVAAAAAKDLSKVLAGVVEKLGEESV
ncbi:MAG: purine-nucleoside phosphorylase [Desulfobacterales bacterium]|nr:purine-nucleoside phosphorylase [Desulfobacterales bacterium]